MSSITACNRCDFRGQDAAELEEHALATEHWLCTVCPRSLTETEIHVCARCVARVRSDLDDIAQTYTLLTAELVHHAHEPLPGGDSLVMLAGGNLTVGSTDATVLGLDDQQTVVHRCDDEPLGIYSADDDPESIIATLANWEADWRDVLNQPADPDQAQTLTSIVGYLNAQLHFAARQHPAFEAFADDSRRLRTRLQLVTATGDWPIVGARCVTCQIALERAYDKAAPCHHGPRPSYQRRWLADEKRRQTPDEARDHWQMQLAEWEQEHARCQQGGADDTWECRRCHRTYTRDEYWLAVRSQHLASAGWVPIHLAAEMSYRPVKTIRTWANRLAVGTCTPVRWVNNRPIRDGETRVLWPDVFTRMYEATRRATRRQVVA